MIDDPRLKSEGYTKKTVFIPVKDWDLTKSTRMWMYRESINPISIIYDLMVSNPAKLKAVFKDINIVFFDNNRFFKMDLNAVEDMKKASQSFMRFIKIFRLGQEEDPGDVDTEFDHKETPEVIKANIVDQIEISKGVDLTPKVAKAAAEKASKKTTSKKAPVAHNLKIDKDKKPERTYLMKQHR